MNSRRNDNVHELIESKKTKEAKFSPSSQTGWKQFIERHRSLADEILFTLKNFFTTCRVQSSKIHSSKSQK